MYDVVARRWRAALELEGGGGEDSTCFHRGGGTAARQPLCKVLVALQDVTKLHNLTSRTV